MMFCNGQSENVVNSYIYLHSKITMAGDVVPYYRVTALVPTLK